MSLHQLDDRERTAIASLASYDILDTPDEPEFDDIVREAAAAFGMPIALISLLDERRQWFKARVGLAVTETPRAISFCTHAVRDDAVFAIPDATADPRFRENPLVTGDPHIRAYAGAPLKVADGSRVGTLCVIDTRPGRVLTPTETALLEALAGRVVVALERRKAMTSAMCRAA